MLKLLIHASLAAIAMCLAMETAAKSPLIDSDTPHPVTSISREQLERLPSGQRLEDILKTCPSTAVPTITRKPGSLIDGQSSSTPFSINCLAPTDVELIEVYKTHNAARAEYGAPPLARDPLLELSAEEYVRQLARSGKMVHASREGRGNIRENISQGLPSWSPRQLMGSWVKEKQNFVPGTFPNVSRTGNWYDVGHWAQMIWIRTVAIGCARAAGIGATWMVCRYGPGGNKDGETVGLPEARPYLVEAPKLPPAEVFARKQAPAASDQPARDTRASLFDLGIYAGGARASDWFNIDPSGEIGTDIILNHDYGYDPALFVGYDFGSFRIETDAAIDWAIDEPDLESVTRTDDDEFLYDLAETEDADTKVVPPKLPGAEVFNPNPPIQNSKLDEIVRKHYEAVMKMASGTPYEQRVSALMAGWYLYAEGKSSCDNATRVAGEGQVRAALAALKQMKTEMAEVGAFSAIDQEEITGTIEDYKSLLNYENPKGASSAKPTADGDPGPARDPAAPELPNKEVFNPADLPQCPLDLM